MSHFFIRILNDKNFEKIIQTDNFPHRYHKK